LRYVYVYMHREKGWESVREIERYEHLRMEREREREREREGERGRVRV